MCTFSGGSDARAPLYNRAGPAVPAAGDGWDTPSSLSAPPVPPAPIRPPPPPITAGSGRSVADILKASTSTAYHNPQPPSLYSIDLHGLAQWRFCQDSGRSEPCFFLLRQTQSCLPHRGMFTFLATIDL
eukprot:4985379-Pyramimonas_sp.AAC.2